MGSCSSVNVKPRQHPTRVADRPDKVYCKKHMNSIVTHFNERTQELICLNCYQNRKRNNREDKSIKEITPFLASIQFKQSEIRILEKLRSQIRQNENNLFRASQEQNKLDSKQKQILEEIHLFVKTVMELIKHIEEELCKETQDTIFIIQNELRTAISKLHSQTAKCTEFVKNIETCRVNGNETFRLKTILECKQYLNSGKIHHIKIKENDINLKLNKKLSLGDIIGRGKDLQKVRLGYIKCDTTEDLLFNGDQLSDISEVSEDNEYSRSSTQQTSSVVSNVSQPSRHTGYSSELSTGDSSVSSQIGDNRHALESNQETSGDSNTQSSQETSGDSNTQNSQETGGDSNNVDMPNVVSRNSRYEQEIANVENTSKYNILDNNHKEVRTESVSQRRSQFVRDSAISRSLDRRVSYSGTSHGQTPTPRRSSQSIVSPGNITTPFFISPRKESMERRIAVKIRDIALPESEEVHNITDTLKLNDHLFVLCDQKNEKLILLDSNWTSISEIKLSGHPHNITKVPGTDKKIAVTIPDENVVKIVEVEDDEFTDKIEKIKLQTKPKCRGINYVNDNMIYTTRNDVAVVRKDDSTRTWKFKYAFRDPVSLCANHRNDVIFVSCLGLKSFGEVVKMHYNNEKIDLIISCPEIKHPVCTTLDHEGFIYICDIDPPSIHQVSQDGKYLRRLLSSAQGKFQHVNFLEGTDTLLATENDCNVISLYEMT